MDIIYLFYILFEHNLLHVRCPEANTTHTFVKLWNIQLTLRWVGGEVDDIQQARLLCVATPLAWSVSPYLSTL